MSYLVEGMRRESFFLPRLRILDLTSEATTAFSIRVDNKIKLEGVGYLVEMIQNNNFPNLEELSLISNGIRDEGLLKLVAMMRYGFLPHLKTVYLSDNKLRDESVKQLTAALAARKLAANAEIYLGCNKISSSVVQSLVSLLYLRPESQDPPLKYVVLEKSILTLDKRIIDRAQGNPRTPDKERSGKPHSVFCLLTNTPTSKINQLITKSRSLPPTASPQSSIA